METSKRIKSEDGEENLSKISLSAFHFQDLTIEVGNEKLYVNRDQLMAESPVFRTMLTGNFKEKNARLIKIPDKDPTTFSLLLRHTLPGFHGLILTESTARRILPLSHEYQTDISKIDKVLATCTGENEYKSADRLIDHIVEAELDILSKYLTACIEKASELSARAFEISPLFYKISNGTKANILMMRSKAIETVLSNCMHALKSYGYGCKCVDCDDKQKVENAKRILDRSKYTTT